MTETIGLDIGSHSIKLVGLKTTSKGPFLTHVGIKEIPYGGNKETVALAFIANENDASKWHRYETKRCI